MNKHHLRLAAAAGLGFATVALLGACAASAAKPDAPLPLASAVDIPRFMGTWHVIGTIPTPFDSNVIDASDNYTLAADGTIDIDFKYRKPDGDGSQKNMKSRGFVDGGNKAIWGVQFIWPIKADYRIAYLSPDYQQVIVARDKRDYVWIMSRSPTLPEAEYQQLVARVQAMGYDMSKLVKVPQTAR